MHTPDELAVEANALEKSYGAVRVLDGVDLQVPYGSVLALLGPNGAGKTTTVRILSTLLRADAGRARVAGFDVVAERHRVRSRISITGQYAAVDELQTGAENLSMVGRLRGLDRSGARRRAAELLERAYDVGRGPARRPSSSARSPTSGSSSRSATATPSRTWSPSSATVRRTRTHTSS